MLPSADKLLVLLQPRWRCQEQADVSYCDIGLLRLLWLAVLLLATLRLIFAAASSFLTHGEGWRVLNKLGLRTAP